MLHSRRIVVQLLFSHLLVASITLATLVGYAAYQLWHNSLQDLEHQTEGAAFSLVTGLLDPWHEYYEKGKERSAALGSIQRQLHNFRKQHPTIQIALLLPSGDLLLESSDFHLAYPRDKLLSEVYQALGEWEYNLTYPWGEAYWHVIVPVQYEEQLLGGLLVALPLKEAHIRWRERLLPLLLAAGVVLLLSSGIATWRAISLTRPLHRLTAGVKRWGEGDYGYRIPPEGPAEIQQLAQAFNALAARLEAHIRDLKAFVAYAGHELRTPLTTVKLRLEALREGIDDPALAQQYLEEAEAEIDRLTRMVNDLLDLSRLEAGETQSTRDFVDLHLLAREVATAFRPLAEQKGVSLEVLAEPGVVSVLAHREEMRRALINLLDNAIKYTPSGGQVRVRVRALQRHIRVEVEDTGPGIPPEDLPHVFERFYRGRQHLRGGAGLGLALVRAIAEAHHGRVGVHSQPGEGSRFWMDIPVRPPKPIPTESTPT